MNHEPKETGAHGVRLRLLRSERKTEGKRLQELAVKLQTAANAKKPQALAS